MATGSTPSFRDRLSRLGFRQACHLLGEEGEALIRQGGHLELEPLSECVTLDARRLSVDLGAARAEIHLDPARPKRLAWCCSCGVRPCIHVGAVLSLVLEEKTALGLARPPDLTPVEALSDEEAAAQALAERAQRAATERMRIVAAEPQRLWTDYAVTNRSSGRSYRVALRGWAAGESHCSCPDFRANMLGTCKHILAVQRRARRRFTQATQQRPYRRPGFEVALSYGEEIAVHLLPPARCEAHSRRLTGQLGDGRAADVEDLLRVVRKLDQAGVEVQIHPDAEDFLQAQLHRRRMTDEIAAIRRDPAAHPLRRELLAVELLPYQLDGIAFAVGAGRAILADDMGLGKTIQGIGVAELLARRVGIQRVLVVCPTSLKSQWCAEIARFSQRSAGQIIGTAAERAGQYEQDRFFTIVNYEQVLRDLPAIERQSWDLIILDEGQRIKNLEAKTSQMVKRLRSPYALVLSGTPLENRLDDLYSIAQFIDDRHLGPDWRFANTHRILNERGRVLGYQQLDRIRARLAPFVLRRTRAMVAKQLPPRQTEIIRIPPGAEQEEIQVAQKRIIAGITAKAFISEMDLRRLQRALLMCRMAADSSYLCHKQAPGESTKLERLRELLGQLAAEDDRKIIIFSEWTTMLDLIEPLLDEQGLTQVRLDGSVPQKKRQELVTRFQKDPECRVFLTTNAGSTGLNLQAANTVINIDLPWNPAVLEQRIARAHRMGQRRPVQVYLLVTEQTIEEGLLQTLDGKAQLALAALDPESAVDAVSVTSGKEELQRKLEVLLGQPEDAPERLQETETVTAEVERRQRVAEAGGRLFGAAIDVLAAMAPANAAPPALTEQIAQAFTACSETGSDGRLRLTLQFGDGAALQRLAGGVAALLAAAGTPPS